VVAGRSREIQGAVPVLSRSAGQPLAEVGLRLLLERMLRVGVDTAQAGDLHADAGLLPALAHRGLGDGLAKLLPTTWQRPQVVQRVLGHATASMTMDLYGHLVDANLWQAARLVGDI
jgi:integrase